jgi:hypothetical protein
VPSGGVAGHPPKSLVAVGVGATIADFGESTARSIARKCGRAGTPIPRSEDSMAKTGRRRRSEVVSDRSDRSDRSDGGQDVVGRQRRHYPDPFVDARLSEMTS